MAQTYGKQQNGKYWHVNTVSDMVEFGLEYSVLPEDHKKGGRYENLVYDFEDSIIYFKNVRDIENPRKLLEANLCGLYDWSGQSQYNHWMYLHRKRHDNLFERKYDKNGDEIFEEDPDYPVSKCDECKQYKIFESLWYGED